MTTACPPTAYGQLAQCYAGAQRVLSDVRLLNRQLCEVAILFTTERDELQAQLDGALIALEGMRTERDELRARLAAAESP